MARGLGIRWAILANPSLGSLAASMFSQGMLLLSGPASARLLGVAGRGEFALLIIIVTFGSFFGGAGLPTAVSYAIASQRIPARNIVKVVAPAWIPLCLTASVLSGFAVFLIVRGETSSARWLEAPLAALCVISTMNAQLIYACVQGEHHFRALNLLRPVAITLTAVVFVVLWLVVGHAGAAVALGVVTAANAAGCLAGGAFLLCTSHAPADCANVSMQSLIRYGLASLAGGNAPLETLQIDQAVVGVLLSRYELGLYAVGSAFDNLPGILVSGVGVIALPRLASATNPGTRLAIMRRAALLSVVLAGAATLFAEAIVGWLLPAAFGDAYVGAVAPARVLILAGFFMGMRRIFVVFLQGLGRPGRTGVGETIALVTLLAFAAVFVPLLGLLGASLALLGAAIAANAYLLFALRDQMDTPVAPRRVGGDGDAHVRGSR